MNRPPIDIPVIGIGPGTQDRAEEKMDILDLPTGSMSTFSNPILPEPEDTLHLEQGKQCLESMLRALNHYQAGDKTTIIDLQSLDADNLDLLNQALGEGEVSLVTEDATGSVLAQESVLAGVWRVQHKDQQNNLLRDTIEIADIPFAVRSTTFSDAASDVETELPDTEHGLMNAPSLLVEINKQVSHWQAGTEPHVINLTLLPVTDQELLFIGSRLGTGPVTILSRGYGNCRIGSTAIKNVWWIKYFNSEDKLILNTIEICDVPAVALAAQEDIQDSAHRLNEILELYR